MARERGVTRKTTTIEHLPAASGDPLAHAIRTGLAEYARLDLSGYAAAYWTAVADISDARLDVFKKMSGHFNKLGTIKIGEVEPEDMESHLVTMWRPGIYQLRPIIESKYYAPSSTQFHVGGDDETATVPGRSDLGGAIAALTELGLVKQLKELKDGLLAGEKKGEEDGMKAADVQVMLDAATKPLTAMLESSERRAAAAEQRNHELQLKLMEMASGKQQTVQSGIGELIKLLPKEALSVLLAPAETPGWAEKAVDALREFGPALVQAVMEYFRPGSSAAVAGASAPPPALPAGPQPTHAASEGGEGRAVPFQLNAEQQEAKKMLIDCIKERDFANAYAMVENFPGFVPTEQGMMPIGPAILGRIDPKVTKPRIYVIQMMQLIPEFSSMLTEADAFIAYVQKRLLDDQEAFAQEQSRRAAAASGSADPKPTTIPTEDER